MTKAMKHKDGGMAEARRLAAVRTARAGVPTWLSARLLGVSRASLLRALRVAGEPLSAHLDAFLADHPDVAAMPLRSRSTLLDRRALAMEPSDLALLAGVPVEQAAAVIAAEVAEREAKARAKKARKARRCTERKRDPYRPVVPEAIEEAKRLLAEAGPGVEVRISNIALRHKVHPVSLNAALRAAGLSAGAKRAENLQRAIEDVEALMRERGLSQRAACETLGYSKDRITQGISRRDREQAAEVRRMMEERAIDAVQACRMLGFNETRIVRRIEQPDRRNAANAVSVAQVA